MIQSLKEKQGGLRWLDLKTNMFNETIEDPTLVDIDACNGIHTWNNQRGGRQ